MNKFTLNATLTVLAIAGLMGEPAVLAEQTFDGVEPDEGIRHELHALQTEVASLRASVTELKQQNASLQNQLAAVRSNRALLLGPFVSVDPNPEAGVVGPNITFSGANVHVVSGLGATDDNSNPSGLGNLIVGYDEPPGAQGTGTPLSPGDRSGSHNLVVGRFNRFTRTAFGGLVAGEANLISNAAATITGGNLNAATGADAAVTGGQSNTASGNFTAVTGGQSNTASEAFAVVTGGQSNLAQSFFALVTGGHGNVAGEIFATITGGDSNTANGGTSSICGGTSNLTTDGADTVCGGSGNTASGFVSVVLGGQNNTTNRRPYAIAPQPPFP
jgi:trimeric autotransporter adhesin